jgi:hypothetical protein
VPEAQQLAAELHQLAKVVEHSTRQAGQLD